VVSCSEAPRFLHGNGPESPTKRGQSALWEAPERRERYIMWAYSEAANVIARYHPKICLPPCGELTLESERERAIKGGRKAPGRGHLVGAPHRTALSGSGPLLVRAGDGGMNAVKPHGPKSPAIDCGTSPKNLIPFGGEEMCPQSMGRGWGGEEGGQGVLTGHALSKMCGCGI